MHVTRARSFATGHASECKAVCLQLLLPLFKLQIAQVCLMLQRKPQSTPSLVAAVAI